MSIKFKCPKLCLGKNEIFNILLQELFGGVASGTSVVLNDIQTNLNRPRYLQNNQLEFTDFNYCATTAPLAIPAAPITIRARAWTDSNDYQVIFAQGNYAYRVVSNQFGTFTTGVSTDTGITVPKSEWFWIELDYNALRQVVALRLYEDDDGVKGSLVDTWTGLGELGGEEDGTFYIGTRSAGSAPLGGFVDNVEIEGVAKWELSEGGASAFIHDVIGKNTMQIVGAVLDEDWVLRDDVQATSIDRGFTLFAQGDGVESWFYTGLVVDFNFTVIRSLDVCGSKDESTIYSNNGAASGAEVYIKRRQGFWHIRVGDYNDLAVQAADTGKAYEIILIINAFSVLVQIRENNGSASSYGPFFTGLTQPTIGLNLFRSADVGNGEWGDHQKKEFFFQSSAGEVSFRPTTDGTFRDAGSGTTLPNEAGFPIGTPRAPVNNSGSDIFGEPATNPGQFYEHNDAESVIEQNDEGIISHIYANGTFYPIGSGTVGGKAFWGSEFGDGIQWNDGMGLWQATIGADMWRQFTGGGPIPPATDWVEVGIGETPLELFYNELWVVGGDGEFRKVTYKDLVIQYLNNGAYNTWLFGSVAGGFTKIDTWEFNLSFIVALWNLLVSIYGGDDAGVTNPANGNYVINPATGGVDWQPSF